MSRLTWDNINPMDSSRYLDAIQKAQATSLAGVEQIGNAYKGYYDNLTKQNTNDMLTALNQAQNPEELAAAQANIAAMQQRWGSGYDMDAVRTAMDERPTVLMQRQSAEMDFKDKQANIAARPELAAIYSAQMKTLGATDEELARFQAVVDSGIDTSSIANSFGQFLTNERNYTNDNYWKKKNYDQNAYQFNATHSQRQHEFNVNSDLERQKFQLSAGKTLADADLEAGTGTTYVAADGSEFTTGGGRGAAAIARYASMFGPLAAGMIYTESKGNPNAVSPAGAQGIIQIMPATAAKPGYKMPPIDLKNSTPEEQIRWGMEYRSRLKKAHGFTDDQATAAFNAGAGKVEQAIKEAKESGGNWLSYLPKETRDYVPRVNRATAQYANGGVPSGVSATPMVGIDRKVQQKIRSEYQNAMLKYNEALALKDQPVNVGNVLAGLTAKEEGSPWTQDAFDIVNAMKDNEQLKGLSAEGITNVYNRAKAWQAKPGTPFIGYNSSAGLKGSINNFIRDEIAIDAERKKHVAKASHPSNQYIQQIQQAFEAQGVSISAQEALRHIDPARYESLYGNSAVKVQEANSKKGGTAAAAKPTPKPKPAASTPTTPVATSANPATPAKASKPTKQELVDFYVKRGGEVKMSTLEKSMGLKYSQDSKLIEEAYAEAAKQAAVKKAKEQADKATKKAKEQVEIARVRKEYEERKKQAEAAKRIKETSAAKPKTVDVDQLRKAFANTQSLSIANANRIAKEEEKRKRTSN